MASVFCGMAIIIFLAISSFSFSGCNADAALIESICRESQDYNFCTSVVGKDPRAAAVDLHGLALVSISVTAIQIRDTLDEIPRILQDLKDPLAQTRLRECQAGYNKALGNFQSAFTTTSRNAYFDAIHFTGIGTNLVIDCHNGFRRNGPIAASPIDASDVKVFKLSEIILIAIDRLIPKKL